MRGDLRLSDLRRKDRGVSKLMNVKIPTHVSDQIQRVARDLGASKTEVIIALLNEGLEVSQEVLKGWKPPKVVLPPPKRVCSVPGCGKAYIAKGYCANHYQAMRRGRLPEAGKVRAKKHA